jgi:hypothetical protein
MPFILSQDRISYTKWADKNNKPLFDKTYWIHEQYWAEYLQSLLNEHQCNEPCHICDNDYY